MKKFVLFVLAVLLLSSAAASFSVGKPNNSISSVYFSGDNLTGWINLSLNKESANSVLESSAGGKINLIDLLQQTQNSGFVRNCNPSSCISKFELKNPAASKTIQLKKDEAVTLGFKIDATNILQVSLFNFTLSSNNPVGDDFPLSLDLLDDGIMEWEAYQNSSVYGDERSGCLNNENTLEVPILTNLKYCEKIELARAPEVEIGAYVTGAGNAEFTMTIEDADGSSSKTCTAAASGNSRQRVSCTPREGPKNYQIKEKGDYFVCINAKSGATYQILYNEGGECGFSGNYVGNYYYDFDVFARPKKYAENINIEFNNTELANYKSDTENLEEYIEEYLDREYDNNCEEECVIPLKIYSGVTQTVTLSDASVSYIGGYGGGVPLSSKEIYNTDEVPALIDSSSYQLLNLEMSGLKAPSKNGASTITISLGGKKVFSKNISIEKKLLVGDLIPTTTGVKYLTKFSVKGSDTNITGYVWDWGDGTIPTNTSIDTASHTFATAGTYILTITGKDSKMREAAKKFEVTVAPASQVVPLLIGNAEANIKKIKLQLPGFSAQEQNSLQGFFRLSTIESKVTELKAASLIADSEEKFEAVLGQLLEIDIPASVFKTLAANDFEFYQSGNNIDLDVLKKIGGGNYGNKQEKYREAVLAWNLNNMKVVMNFSSIAAAYGTGNRHVLSAFSVNLANTGGDDAYLVIKDMENLSFGADYSQKKEGGYQYIKITEGSRNIFFSTTEEIDFSNIPAFISPSLDKLAIADWSPFEETGKLKKWIIFSIIVFGILVLVLFVWLILKKWYEVKYESYLFKNRNNLYNLVSFIHGERSRGAKEKDIVSKLRKAGWSSEQLRYAMRKHAGERTGLPELIAINAGGKKEK
jgi:hypothetical protein